MPAVFVSKGLQDVLKTYDDYLLAEGALVFLYKNDYTPVFNSTQDNFTEADFPGYASVPLERQGVEFDMADGAHWRQDWKQITFTCNADGPGQQVYGYYVYIPGTGVEWAERFGAPQYMSHNGDKIVLPMFTTTKSEF